MTGTNRLKQFIYRMLRDDQAILEHHLRETSDEPATFSIPVLEREAQHITGLLVQSGSQFMSADQNAREEFTVGPCDVWMERDGVAVFAANGEPFILIGDDLCVGGRDGAIERAQLVARLLNAHQEDAEPSPLPSLAHDLRSMAERMEESGMRGDSAIARCASRVAANVEKLVTCFLPPATRAMTPCGEIETVGAPWIGHSGNVYVRGHQPEGEHEMAFTLDELDPIYEIKAVAYQFNDVRVSGFDGETFRIRGVERDVAEFDPPLGGPDQPIERKGEVHHLSVDPDQEITVHGSWAGWRGNQAFEPDRHNCADDEFPPPLCGL